jgi:5-methylcytosine-specific restriction endonuclease McrA
LLARLFPQPDVAASVRKLPSRATAAVAEACGNVDAAEACTAPSIAPTIRGGLTPTPPAFTSTAPPKPALVRPLAPERYEIRFTADGETRRRLREAQDLLGHALPSADLAAVFHRALTVLVADLKRRKFAATSRPRARRAPNADSRTPTATVRREVAARDTGRCRFVSRDGHRCGETRFLEFHHVVPVARGGQATVDNLQLRCRAHNGHEVDLFFGPGKRWVKRRVAKEVSKATCSLTGTTPLPSG